jgi:hypothetical protein
MAGQFPSLEALTQQQHLRVRRGNNGGIEQRQQQCGAGNIFDAESEALVTT